MALPTLADIPVASELHKWLQYYCRLGYEVALSCRGPEDPDPRCQHLVARRQALSKVIRQHLEQHYWLEELQAQRLFAQWNREVFGQLLESDIMRHLDLDAALTESLPI